MNNRALRRHNSFKKIIRRKNIAKNIGIDNHKIQLYKNGWACNCMLCKPPGDSKKEKILKEEINKEINEYKKTR